MVPSPAEQEAFASFLFSAPLWGCYEMPCLVPLPSFFFTRHILHTIVRHDSLQNNLRPASPLLGTLHHLPHQAGTPPLPLRALGKSVQVHSRWLLAAMNSWLCSLTSACTHHGTQFNATSRTRRHWAHTECSRGSILYMDLKVSVFSHWIVGPSRT